MADITGVTIESNLCSYNGKGDMMSKFPLLRFYRSLLWIAAATVFIVGILTVVSPLMNRGTSYFRPDVLSLLIVSLPWLGLSLGFGIFAEIITLFLHIENHLDEMKQTQERYYRLRNINRSEPSE